MDVARGLLIFPPEIWANFIATNLRNYYDVERLCIAFPDLEPYLASLLNKLRQQEALKCLLGNQVLTPSQALCLRKVCKLWRDVVDDYYSQPPEEPNFRDFPAVVIKLPLNERGLDRVMKIAQHDQCPFIGERLCLALQDWTGNVDMKESQNKLLKSTSAVWKHVKHLILRLEDEDFVQDSAVVEPWLLHMTNVVSINCDLVHPGAHVINYLPNPHSLEYIGVCNVDRSMPNDWSRLLGLCCDNLVRLESYCMDVNLQRALAFLKFARLEQLRIEKYYYEGDDEGGEGEDVRLVLDILTADRFPKLKLIGIPVLKRRNLECDNGQFFTRLMSFSNRFPTVDAIEMYLDYEPNLSFETFAVKGSRFVKRLTLSCVLWPFHDVTRRIAWIKALSDCFPGVRTLKVGSKVL